MFCGKCGNELPEGATLCDKCGTIISSETQKEDIIGQMGTESVSFDFDPAEIQQETIFMDESSYNQLFVEQDEHLLGTLGNGWIANMLFYKLKKCNALLTDKRLYLQGTFFSGSGKTLTSQRYEKVIDLEDITGSGFLYSKENGILISLFIYVIFTVIGGIFSYIILNDRFIPAGCIIGFCIGLIIEIIRYLINRKTYFLIEYAGGGIRFDASIIGIADVRDFQKQIRRAKDKAKGKI